VGVAKALAAHGFDVQIVDISKERLERARERNQERDAIGAVC
jgi:3-hydroxyacyl-CoA dehydrogenase